MKNKYLSLALTLTTAAALTFSSVGSTAVLASSSDTSTESSVSTNSTSDTKKGPGSGEMPPEKPDGENSSMGPGNGETPPEKPDGENGMGPRGGNGSGSTESHGGPGGNMSGGPGGSASDITYTAVNEYSEDAEITDEFIASTGTDENAVLVTGGASVTIDGATITRESSDSTGGDNSSFYGVGAAVLASDGTAYISDTTIDTDAAGGAGAFAYGDGVIYIADTAITTEQNTSGGIHAAGGGTLYAYDVVATTNGRSAAAIRSDRGGGTMVIDGGTYTSNGSGSPAVYCTADISINDAELIATGSEAVCIEGLNSLRLYDCSLTGDMPTDNEQNDCVWNVILYQSMSGDSEEGNSTFQMVGGELTALSGGMFYTTNTESTFVISDVDITYADESDFFLKCTGNSNKRGWGSAGSNGADCTFTAIDQKMEGNILWDSISELDFYITDGSALTGAFINDETNAGNGGDGYCSVYIDDSSVWAVTADSTVTNLYNAGTIIDEDGNTVTIVGADGTEYVSGSSEYTITVTGEYSEEADLSGASEIDAWENHEVEKPAELE